MHKWQVESYNITDATQRLSLFIHSSIYLFIHSHQSVTLKGETKLGGKSI